MIENIRQQQLACNSTKWSSSSFNRYLDGNIWQWYPSHIRHWTFTYKSPAEKETNIGQSAIKTFQLGWDDVEWKVKRRPRHKKAQLAIVQFCVVTGNNSKPVLVWKSIEATDSNKHFTATLYLTWLRNVPHYKFQSRVINLGWFNARFREKFLLQLGGPPRGQGTFCRFCCCHYSYFQSDASVPPRNVKTEQERCTCCICIIQVFPPKLYTCQKCRDRRGIGRSGLIWVSAT